jgi:hypothetical protein
MDRRIFLIGGAFVALTVCSQQMEPAATFPSTSSVGAVDKCQSLDPGRIVSVTPLQEVVEILHVIRLKDEFETDQAYRKRLNPVLERLRALNKSVTGSKDLRLLVPFAKPQFEGLRYNADRNEFKVGSILGIFDTALGSGALVLASYTDRTGAYFGSTVLGLPVKVDKYNLNEVRLDPWPRSSSAMNLSDLGYRPHNFGSRDYWPRNYHPISFQMNPDEARKLKSKLALVVSGQLRYPYFTRGMEHLPATINDPNEVKVNYDQVYMDANCAAVIDQDSGKSYYTLVLDQ